MSLRIEDIYRLSPLQHGMLFHTLYDERSDVRPYVVQLVEEITGRLDVGALRRAWDSVVQRHTILRSSFVWERVEEPVQVVHRSVAVPFEVLDWSRWSGARQDVLLEQFIADDRAAGFDITEAPLLRLTLAHLGAGRWLQIWTFHHLLLDGWSVPVVRGEVLACYKAEAEGHDVELPEAAPYSRYVEWLSSPPEAGEY